MAHNLKLLPTIKPSFQPSFKALFYYQPESPQLGFTDLISRSSSGKAISPSHYDKEFVVATTKKTYKALNPLDIGKSTCNAFGSNLENSYNAKLHNYVIISILKSINSTVPICNSKQYRTEFCNSKCIPSDFSDIDPTKISLSNSAFLYFLVLNCSLIINSQDLKNVRSVNMSNNQIVFNLSTSGTQVTIEFPVLSEHEKNSELAVMGKENIDLINLLNPTERYHPHPPQMKNPPGGGGVMAKRKPKS